MEFIPAEKLRQIYPQAASANTAGNPSKGATTEDGAGATADIDTDAGKATCKQLVAEVGDRTVHKDGDRDATLSTERGSQVAEDGNGKVVDEDGAEAGRMDGKEDIVLPGGDVVAETGRVDRDGKESLPFGGKTEEASKTADDGAGLLPPGNRTGDAGKASEDGKGSSLPVAVGNAPRKGIEISLLRLRLADGAATLIGTRLRLILACSRCSSRDQLDVLPGQLYTVTCSPCHGAQLIQLNVDIAHSMSAVIGYINLEGCQPLDLVLTTSQFLVGCIACSNDTTIDVSVASDCYYCFHY